MTDSSSVPETPSAGTQTFVIRICPSDGTEALRGHIQHVRSRERAYFATRERLMSLIQDQLLGVEHDRCPS